MKFHRKSFCTGWVKPHPQMGLWFLNATSAKCYWTPHSDARCGDSSKCCSTPEHAYTNLQFASVHQWDEMDNKNTNSRSWQDIIENGWCWWVLLSKILWCWAYLQWLYSQTTILEGLCLFQNFCFLCWSGWKLQSSTISWPNHHCHPNGSGEGKSFCAPLADNNISPINHSFLIETVEVSSDELLSAL